MTRAKVSCSRYIPAACDATTVLLTCSLKACTWDNNLFVERGSGSSGNDRDKSHPRSSRFTSGDPPNYNIVSEISEMSSIFLRTSTAILFHLHVITVFQLTASILHSSIGASRLHTCACYDGKKKIIIFPLLTEIKKKKRNTRLLLTLDYNFTFRPNHETHWNSSFLVRGFVGQIKHCWEILNCLEF